MMKLVDNLVNIKCPAATGLFPLEAPFSKGIQNKENHLRDTDINDVFDILYNILGDLEEIVGVFEIVIDSTTVYDEWIDGDYFESGLYAGKGVVNAYFVVYGLITKYFTTG